MQGDQRPRIYSVPRYVASSGGEAIELAAMVGVDLDPWQQLVLKDALGERPDGTWAASSVGVVCPRQNGKNAILEAVELAGLFLLGERLIVHTAHQYDTSMEAYNRLKFLIQNTPSFDKRVRRYNNAHGNEGIELRSGQRIRFRTRTKGGGRGFSGDRVIFDEAMEFPQASLNAILPIVSARPNPQVWYTGSAVDKEIHANGEVLARLRAAGVAGDDERLAYFEWSVDAESPDELTEERAMDPVSWAAANPAFGRRITSEYVRGESIRLGPRGFAVERLGVGDWPSLTGGDAVIDPDQWLSLVDAASRANDPVCVAFDVTPNRATASIAACGLRDDGLPHVEVVERRSGTGWLAARLRDIVNRHAPLRVVCDSGGPAASLIPELKALGVEVVTTTTAEHAAGCGMFFDAVDQSKLKHLGTAELTAAVKGAAKRPVGDRWLWDRKNSDVDISPLVACTLAFWAHQVDGPSVYEDRGMVSFSL